MYLIKNSSTDPAFNLALEEFFLLNSDREFFCFWRNRPTVVIGRNQDASAEVDLDFIKEHRISLVRRNTGGGAVFHDLGNVNYSYIAPCDKNDFFNFEKFSRPVISALASLGVNASLNGRNDITVDGLKVSGNAQYMHKQRILHHGTLLFSSDFSYMQGALRVDPRKLKAKGVSSVKSRVANISDYCKDRLTTDEFIRRLENHILSFFDDISVYEPSQSDISEINCIAEKKYRSDEWTFIKTGNYEFRNSAAMPFGILNIGFDVEKGRIVSLSITGDFFGIRDISEFCEKFINVPHDKDSITNVLNETDVSEYISGCQASDILPLFF